MEQLIETYPIYGVYENFTLYDQPLFNSITSYIDDYITQETGLKNAQEAVKNNNSVERGMREVDANPMPHQANNIGSGMGRLFTVRKGKKSKWI